MGREIKDLEEYVHFLETVLDHLSEAVYIGDENGKIIFVNREAERMDHLSRKYVIGRNENEVYGTENGKLVAGSGQPIVDERTSYRTDEGRLKYVLHSVYPFYHKNEIKGNFAISRDITREDKYIAKIYELQQELKAEHREANKNGTRYIIDHIIGKSVAMITAITMAERAGKFGTNVLICGETGTGKEMFAQSVHNCGLHLNEPFVGINCGAIPENLLESILFGTEKGAFTGAQSQEGLFESAKNGTLFLDEIDSMSLAMQAKLLRVLQEKSVRRLGGKREIPVTCRVISATNINIDHALETKKIRLDLYYRLSSVVLQIPPLRERNKDVLLLAQEFINRFQDIFGTHVKGLSSEVADMFLNYDWPGNVRELEHVIEGAMMVVGEHDEEICPRHIPERIYRDRDTDRVDLPKARGNIDLARETAEFERGIIQKVLRENRGNVTAAAKSLHLHRNVLYRKMKKYGIER